MWEYRRIRQTTFILTISSGVLLGLILANVGINIAGWAWLVIALILLGISLKKQLWVIVPLIVCGFIVGNWRGSDVASQLHVYKGLYDKNITLVGTVKDDPAQDDGSDQQFRLQNVRFDDQQLPGEIEVSTFSHTPAKRGDTVTVYGKLRNGFGNYQAKISFATLQAVNKADDPVLNFRDQFAAGVRRAMVEPQASLGLGFVIGERSSLPTELDEQMKLIGLTHIVVASGYNLTILVRMARRLFSKHSKYLVAAVSITLMGGFLLVTGFSPSMVRATLVSGLVLWAWYYGRRVHPLVLILFAAALTALVQPTYIWSDVGWYLSFLSFGGVLLLAPLLQKRTYKTKKAPLLIQVAIETISAQIATLPLVLFIFGKLALLSIPANVLVVPLIPFAMLATFIAGITGIILPAIANVIALPANYIIGYMLRVIEWLAALPWAQIPFVIDTVGLIILVIILLISGFLLWRRLHYDYLESSIIE